MPTYNHYRYRQRASRRSTRQRIERSFRHHVRSWHLLGLVLQIRSQGLYLSRISSESNPVDAPSRADFMFLQEAGAEWVDLKPSPEVLDFAKWDEIVDDRLLES